MDPQLVVASRTLEDRRVAGRSVHCAVRTLTDGGFVMEGQVLGGGEYEWARRLDAGQTARLGALLGVAPADLLDAVVTRFPDAASFEEHLREHGLDGTFWSRRED
ncbi:hypothetical protein RDV89_11655 [Nocardioides zeae]|uniref:Uncharacterized protein n=1 Tax=Nocardioides imazamoxiresistens TaxID=3231893 RepID=A0ABU3PY32_9ACTN|nr:hypothetical protein [Nocardioides zeae]MDT9593727.1 hypothetical protein [Nocardioides zeae]